MGNRNHLSNDQKISLKHLGKDADSVSAVARNANISRQAATRWLERTSIAPKSRRPKSSTGPCLLPVQRQVIAELVRLTKFQRKHMLPLIHRVFPVFSGLSETGQRRIWDEVWGKDRTYSMESDFGYRTNPYCHVSTFRITGCLIASEKQPENAQLLMLGCETASGAIVYRLIKNNQSDICQFVVDLIRNWPLSISEIAMVTNADGGFPSVKRPVPREKTALLAGIQSSGSDRRKTGDLHIYGKTELDQRIAKEIERIKTTQIHMGRYDEKFALPSVKFDPSANCSDLILIRHWGSRLPQSAVKLTVGKFLLAYNTAKAAGVIKQAFMKEVHFYKTSPSERLIMKWRSYRYDGGNNTSNEHWATAEALRALLEAPLPK